MRCAQHSDPNSQALPHPVHLSGQRTAWEGILSAERQQQLPIQDLCLCQACSISFCVKVCTASDRTVMSWSQPSLPRKPSTSTGQLSKFRLAGAMASPNTSQDVTNSSRPTKCCQVDNPTGQLHSSAIAAWP